MKPVKLRIASDAGGEATICCDGSHGGHDDYVAVVSITGQIENKKICGVGAVQSFYLGRHLIERLTQDKRIGKDGDNPMPGSTWRIEVFDARAGKADARATVCPVRTAGRPSPRVCPVRKKRLIAT